MSVTHTDDDGNCEFCGDPVDETITCDDCGAETHTQCLCNSLCPWCYECNITSNELSEQND